MTPTGRALRELSGRPEEIDWLADALSPRRWESPVAALDVPDAFNVRERQLSSARTEVPDDCLAVSARGPVSNTKTGYKMLIRPSKESVAAFKHRMKREWSTLVGHNAGRSVQQIATPSAGMGELLPYQSLQEDIQ